MRFLTPLCVFITVAAFHSALSASLESAEKEEVVPQQDELTKLKKIDQMEFEADQKNQAAQVNVTEEQTEETRYLEAAKDGSVEEQVESDPDKTAAAEVAVAEGGASSDAAAAHEASTESDSGSSEEADGRQRREHHEAKAETVSSSEDGSQDLTKEKDVLE